MKDGEVSEKMRHF